MSTILMALKKSQQQRDRGAVPTLSSAPPPAPVLRHRPWSWLMLGGVALNGAAVAMLAWWLGETMGFEESTAEEVARSAAPISTEQQVMASEPSVDDASPKSLLLAPTTDVEGHRVSTTPQNTPRQTTSQSTSIAETMRHVNSTKPPESGPEDHSSRQVIPKTSAQMPGAGAMVTQDQLAAREPQDANTPSAPSASFDLANPTPSPEAARPAALQPKDILPAASAEKSTDQPTVASPDPYASVPMLHSLSYTVRTVLPDLSILVHVYGEEPRDRFVIIQSRKYREGDVLADDLALEAITPSGAVLRYKDTAFRIKP